MPVTDDIKTAYRGLFLIVTIGVLLLVITSVVRSCRGEGVEGWITYQRSKDNTIRTGIDGHYPSGSMGSLTPSAPAFYLVPEYRMPYDWPRGFQTNYPVPHIEPLVTIN